MDRTAEFDVSAQLARTTVAPAAAVSWGAVLAGAAGAAALSLILLILGTGLGLSSVSPWSGEGAGAVAFGLSTILWITFTQVAASGMGGYLAGRLRTRWPGTQADEVYFRDTAHGFLAWAVASLATAALLTSAIGSIVGGGAQAAASVAGKAAAATVPTDSGDTVANQATVYFVDSLFRRDVTAQAAANASAAAPGGDLAHDQVEAARIFFNGLRMGSLPAEDARYAAQVVAQRTGLAAADAEKRVNDVFTRLQARIKDTQAQAREVTDKARKASAYAALWLFVSLLAGAFFASLAATFGGRQRDL